MYSICGKCGSQNENKLNKELQKKKKKIEKKKKLTEIVETNEFIKKSAKSNWQTEYDGRSEIDKLN